MFRTLLVAAGLLLALGSFSTADATRSRTRAPATTEAAAGATQAPHAGTTRRARRTRGEAQSRRHRTEARNRQRRGTQTAAASGSRRGSRPAADPR
jgi:hypothetical protein